MSTKTIALLSIILLSSYLSSSQEISQSGNMSIGTRVTTNMFGNEGGSAGLGGQFRLRFSDKVNSEWFADYITSTSNHLIKRDDYHIGWSLMFYTGPATSSSLLQPYILAGHCFDYSKMSEKKNPSNNSGRLSMAMQAGAGTHINITPLFDFSLSAHYMIHLGKEIDHTISDDHISFTKAGSTLEGHLLTTLSINYKIGDLW